MLSVDLKDIKKELEKLARRTHNLRRKSVRRAVSAAYEKSWGVFKAEFPFIKKNAHVNGSRSFSERTQRILSLAKEPMYGILKASKRKISALHAVRGKKEPFPQKGIPVASRKRIALSKQVPTLKDAKRLYIAKVGHSKKQPFLFSNQPKSMRKQVFPSIPNMLEPCQKDIIDAGAKAIQEVAKEL